MAKTRRAPSLVVRAPRHASRRVRPVLAAEIRRIVKQSDASPIDLDDKLVANDPTHPLGISSDNASEWNSLLISARAERGPQWDVATQRFMVDYGSHLYFDPTPLTFVEEPTPAPEEVNAPAGPSAADPSPSWQSDPRFSQYSGGNGNGSGNISNVSTPSRTSLRLQHQQHQQQQPLHQPMHQQHIPQHHQQHHPQHHQQHPHQSLNGYGNGIGMTNPYPYGLANGRAPEQQQQHYTPAQAQVQMQVQASHSYYDGSHGQVQSQPQTPGHAPHGMTNGIALGGVPNPMMQRQMSMGSSMGPTMGMGMEYGGGPMAGSPEDARRRSRSQQEGHMMEMGW